MGYWEPTALERAIDETLAYMAGLPPCQPDTLFGYPIVEVDSIGDAGDV